VAYLLSKELKINKVKDRKEYYKIYFENLSPSTFNVESKDETIVISGINKKYPQNFNDTEIKEIEFKKGGKVAKTWKEKFNKKYGNELSKPNSLKDISKKTGVSTKGLKQIKKKGIGAWKSNIGSVRLKGSFKKNSNTKKYPRNVRIGKEQWAMARVYSAVMGGKASKVDAKELKMKTGGYVPKTDLIPSEPSFKLNTYDFSGYDYQRNKQEELGVFFLLTGEYERVAKEIYNKDYSVWLYYNYITRANISWKDCKIWFEQAQNYFSETMPVPIELKANPYAKDGRSFASWFCTPNLNNADSLGFDRNKYFKYRDLYYFQEVNMVGNYEYKNGGWGTYYEERKTGLLIPYFENTSYHFTTLIHEFAHCLDFQKQLLSNIKNHKKNTTSISIENNVKGFTNDDSGIVTENLTNEEELELKLYGAIQNNKEIFNQPITNHFSEFVDSLIEVLKVCKEGLIPISKVIEQETIDMQIILNGVYGDLLIEQRVKQKKIKKEQAKADELRTGKRFGWNISKNKTLNDYILNNSKYDNITQIFNTKSKKSIYTFRNFKPR